MNSPDSITINGITLSAPRVPRQKEVFSADALSFLARLHREFGRRAAASAPQEQGSPHSPETGGELERSWRALVERHLAEPVPSFITPRRLSRPEGRIISGGEPLSAGLTDFGLHLSRNARRLLAEGRAPFVSLLGIETEEELELWQDLFLRAEEMLGLPDGTIRAIHISPRSSEAQNTEDELGGTAGAEDSAEVTVLARRDGAGGSGRRESMEAVA